MKSKAVMFLGTGSDVGKSILAAALCRVLKQDGFKVAPFKAQNMALNSFVTASGGEMGRAQVVQAEAAGIEPHVDMNPVLLKPTSHVGSQVIVLGKPIGTMTAQEYYNFKKELFSIVVEAFERLAADYEVIVLEGAGSAVELNLKEHDIVNLSLAKLLQVPALLVGDIDRGGIFASMLGSLWLMEPEEKDLIKGLIVNKFRGDPALFRSGVDIMESYSRKPVLGVVPHFSHIIIHEEDSVALSKKKVKDCSEGKAQEETIHLGVLRLPYISNYTDFDPLEQAEGVKITYFERPEKVFNFDAVIIPGSKNTLYDLRVLHENGMVDVLRAFFKAGRMVVGICGGYQMMGICVRDPLGVESNLTEIEGIGLIPMVTEMFNDKITYQVEARINRDHSLWSDLALGERTLKGYEIHMGRSVRVSDQGGYLFKITERRGADLTDESFYDGLSDNQGLAWGTYIHGVFDNDWFRSWFIQKIAALRGKGSAQTERNFNFQLWKTTQYDLLAEHFRKHVNMTKLYSILGL